MTIIVSEDDNQDFSDNNAFLAVKLIFDKIAMELRAHCGEPE